MLGEWGKNGFAFSIPLRRGRVAGAVAAMSKAYIAAVVGRGASVVGKSLVAEAAGVTSGW